MQLLPSPQPQSLTHSDTLHVLCSETSLLTSLCSKCPLSKSHLREVSWPCHSCQCPPWRHHALRATVSPDTLAPPWALRWPGFALGEWPHPQCWHPDSQAGAAGSPRLETLHQSDPIASAVSLHWCLKHLLLSKSDQQKQMAVPISSHESLGSLSWAGFFAETWGIDYEREKGRERDVVLTVAESRRWSLYICLLFNDVNFL